MAGLREETSGDGGSITACSRALGDQGEGVVMAVGEVVEVVEVEELGVAVEEVGVEELGVEVVDSDFPPEVDVVRFALGVLFANMFTAVFNARFTRSDEASTTVALWHVGHAPVDVF